MKSLKAEVHGLKRSISELTEQQRELFRMVKSLKKTSEASHFDMGILAQFYCTNGCYPIATDDKKKLLEEEFLDSASGLTVEELVLCVTKYAVSKYSYWRSTEEFLELMATSTWSRHLPIFWPTKVCERGIGGRSQAAKGLLGGFLQLEE
ncbi:Hypothetical predicted protein [Paramuricea clavata]|uniref:Uncharacterized protein n=1 Tax=Paramuricea clavata TaxID=317549 RepID=A0A6S7H503_PARCT|nr:Hypothetical predicted protein [Paramuricea clavata]